MDIRTGDHGEVEVINYILKALGLLSGHLVEVGAWDGKLHSNIYHLIQAGWSGTLIEIDPEKFKALEKNMESFDVKCVCAGVSLAPGHSINDFTPEDFDLFSLDIDGNDYWVWKDLEHNPAVVIVEYNSNWEGETTVPYDLNHQWDGSQFFGASAKALYRLAESKGYDLVGFVKYRNLFFVRKDINTLPVMEVSDLDRCLQYPHHREMLEVQKAQLVHDPHLRKLHLGCGSTHLPGFVNIDLRWLPGVDEIADIRYLHSRDYPPMSADLIYASHILEHFSRWEYKSALARWYDILKVGGVLRLAVPDFDALVDHYQDTGELSDIRGLLYGGQDYKENRHHWCWNFDSMKADLEELGFRDVRRWDWRDTEHAHIDDVSQAYLPHLDKDVGRLVSLNVEATR